jgi:hypothetical protein
MRPNILAILVLFLAANVSLAALTAEEIIDRNLRAVGGADGIRAIETMILRGATGSALLPPSEEITLYLRKPDSFKQVGSYRVILCDGGRYLFNDGGEPAELEGGDLEGILYRIGFYHNAFSLLKWERHFASATLLGLKRYGPAEQYEILFRGVEEGRDLLVYVDTETWLIDRLVFVISQEGAGEIKVVNQLRDWKEFGGILMPTRIVYDKVGWEVSPTHFVIESVKINPELDDALFESAEVDFGSVAIEGNRLQGEIFGEMDGSLLTNLRQQDLAEAGIEELDWLDLKVGDSRLRVRYLGNIQRSAAHIKPDEVYITTYPISGFRRLMLLGWGFEVTERIPCAKGDQLYLSPAGGASQ